MSKKYSRTNINLKQGKHICFMLDNKLFNSKYFLETIFLKPLLTRMEDIFGI